MEKLLGKARTSRLGRKIRQENVKRIGMKKIGEVRKQFRLGRRQGKEGEGERKGYGRKVE